MTKQRPKEYEWSSHVSYTRALEDYCDALEGQLQEQEPKVDMCRIAQFKLDSLLNDGFVVNGYAIERRNGDLVTRGFITDGGMVCWWFERDHEPMSPPQRQPLPHEQAKALVAKYGNDPLNLVFQTEAAHGIEAKLKEKNT
jgi:hypothetical protein